MQSTIILNFTDGPWALGNYTTLDISRNSGGTNVNVTNTNQDFAFFAAHSHIQKNTENDKPFSITIKQDKGQITLDDMTVNYYLSAGGEVLHFGQRLAQHEQDNQQDDNLNTKQ